jgi:hypothetical protein
MAASKVFLRDKTTGNVASYTPEEARTAVGSGGYAVADAGEARAAQTAGDEAYRASQTSGLAAFGEAAASGLVDAAIALPKAAAMQANAPGVIGRAIGEAIAMPADPRQAAATRAEMQRQQSANRDAIARRILQLTGSEGLGIDIGEALTAPPSLTSGPLGAISGRQAVGDIAGILTSGGDLSKADERSQEYDAAARQRAIDAPGAAFAGGVAGNVAGALLTGGGVSALATKGTGLAARLGLMAADGALGGIGAADESAWLRDGGRAKAEDVLASMGIGAVLGGALGGLGEAGGAAGGSLWRRATTGMGQDVGLALDPAAAAALAGRGGRIADAVQPLTEKAAKTLVKGAKGIIGYSDEVEDAYVQGLTSKAFREVVNDPKAAADTVARTLAPAMNTFDEVTEAASKTFQSPLKAQEVSGWLSKGGGVGEAAQIATAKRQAIDVAERLERAVAELAGEDDVQGFIRGVPTLLRKRAEAAGTATEGYLVLDMAKQELDNLVKGARIKLRGGALKGSERQGIVDALFNQGGGIDKITNEVRKSLEDESVWGAAGLAQRERNAAITQTLRLKKAAQRLYQKGVETDVIDGLAIDKALQQGEEFTGELGGVFHSGIRKTGVVDEDTFARNLMRSGRTDSRPADEIFDAYLRSIDTLAQTVKKHGGEGVDADALSAAVATTNRARTRHLNSLRGWNALQDAQERGGNSLLRSVADSAPLLGAMVFGPAGAAVGSTLALVARGATDPTGTIRAVARLDRLTELVDGRITSGARDLLRSSRSVLPTVNAAQARGTVARGAGAAAGRFARKDQSPSDAYAEKAAAIQTALADPAKMAADADESLGEVARRFPQLAGSLMQGSVNVASFLQSKMPAPPTEDTMFGGQRVAVSNREADKWGAYWVAATDPLVVLDLAKHGQLQREHVEALQACYPDLHARLSTAIIGEIRAGKTPYAARVAADRLLGLDGAGEPSDSPAAQLQRAQAAQAVASQPKQSRQAPRIDVGQPSSATIWR